MKRKSPRGIPDFSHAPKPNPSAPAVAREGGVHGPAHGAAAPRSAQPATVKPQANSAKSGRRGQ